MARIGCLRHRRAQHEIRYQGAHHVYDPKTFTNDLFLAYRVNNGIPNQLTQTLIPFDRKDRVRYAASTRRSNGRAAE